MKNLDPIKKYEIMLNKAIESNKFESFENENIENIENIDEQLNEQDFEDLENIENLNHARRVQLARKILSHNQRRNFGKPFLVNKQAQYVQSNMNINPNSVAVQFDIKILRESINIAAALPIVLFAPIHFDSRYNGLLPSVASPNSMLSLSSEASDNIFTFTDNGAIPKTDNVRISCLNIPYVTLMRGLLLSEMKINKMRIMADPTDYSLFFAQPLGVAKRSMFGKISEVDTIPFTSQKSPNNYAQNIIDVDLNIHLQNDKGLTYFLPQSTKEITFSFFANMVVKK